MFKPHSKRSGITIDMNRLAASGGAGRDPQIAFAKAEMTCQQGEQCGVSFAILRWRVHRELQRNALGLFTQAEDAALRGFWGDAYGQRRAVAPETER